MTEIKKKKKKKKKKKSQNMNTKKEVHFKLQRSVVNILTCTV